MIRLAAEVATARLKRHPQRIWIALDQNRISNIRPCPTRRPTQALRNNVDQLFRDTEEVISHIWADVAKP